MIQQLAAGNTRETTFLENDMNKISTLITALALGCASTLAMAQQPPGPPPEGGKGPGMHGPHDCSKAPDEEKKARCEAHQAARKAAMEKCKDLKAEEHRACMMAAMPRKDK